MHADLLTRLRASLSPEPLPEVRADELGVAPEIIETLKRRFDPGLLRPAAVLVPVLAGGAEPRVLLTERASHLPQHPGQISFPGGRCEERDCGDAVATALRETQEEIGLDPAEVEVLGYLPAYPTFTGYRITPVLGWIGRPVRFVPDPREVSSLLEVPLQHALEPRNYRLHLVEREGFTLPAYELRHGAQRIWGATAAMLHELSRRYAGGVARQADTA